MAPSTSTVQVLLIRPWIHSLAPLRASLGRVGFEARFTRVDIEPALSAALARESYDVVVVDPATPGLTRSTIEGCLRDHRIDVPIIVLEDIESLGERVKVALASRRS